MNATDTHVETPWLRVDDAAAYCNVHRATIFRAARERRLEHVRIGGRGTVLTTRAWCDEWLHSLRQHVVPIGGGR